MVQLRGNLGSGRSLGILSISLEIKAKFLKTLEIGGACVQTSWPRTLAGRRTRGASWRPSRGQAVTWESSGQKTSASRLDCLARQRLGGQWRWTRAVLLEGNRLNSFNFPKSLKVCPKLGEQCRTQVITSASSGDLQPTLGEEPCAPSGARSVCCLPLQQAMLQSLGERRDQVPGVPPVALGDLAHHQVSPHSQSAPAQRQHPTSRLVCSMVPSVVPAVVSSLPSWTLCSSTLPMVMPTKTRLWRFLTGESPLANWVVLLLAACTLKQVKTGHLICPKIPEAPKSGALRSTDLANLLVLAP